MNPFYSSGINNMPPMFGNMANALQQFQQFRNTFQGNPQQKVQELLNSGQMSQSQYNQFYQMASMLTGLRK